MGFDLSKLNKLKKDELYVDDEEEKRKKSEQAVSKQTSSSEKVALNPSTSIATNLTLPRSLAINQNNTNNNDLPTAKTSKTSSSTKSSNQNLKEINSSKIGVKNNIQYEDNKEEKETVLGKLEKSFLEKLKSKGNNSYKDSVSLLPKASSLSKYEPIKNNQNIDDLSVEELQKNNIPITSNKDARLVALRNKDYYTKPKNTTSDYFKSSEAFEDGYQFGDVTKTALSTAGDIGVHATKSIMGIGEGIGDLITYARANSAEKKGDIEKANSLRQEAQQSAMDYIFNDAEHAVDKNSIIGDKGDQLVEGLGYIAGISAIGYATGGLGAAAGLSTAGASTAATVATTATTFSTSMGNGMTEAYQSGASNDEAFKYGLIAGLAEAGSELLFGGLGKASGAVGLSKSALPVDDLLAEQISNLFKSRLGKNLSQYAVKASAEGVEEVVSGFMQAIGKKVTYMSDVDLMQLIKDENLLEQFIDGTILSAIAQSPSFVKSTTKGNNFLSVEDNGAKNQNNSTTQGILQEQQRITPQEIKTAQNENMGQIDSELSVINESKKHTELSDMLNNKDLPMQYYQYEKSDNAKVNSLKESASKYFNNSEQTKNYISMLEQIVTDKNIEIRFEDNLKTPDGKTANGSYSDGVITINPNSSGTGEFIAVHELTHAIGTNEMVKMIENFKKSNVEFSTEMKALLDNYSSTEINEEALADVSAQLLGNQEFINNVAQNNSNIFKKIYSEIKYLWHQFRGYKNQNQFVEDLYYKWTKAYNSSNELNSTTNYSTETLEDGTTYVKAENNKFIKEDGTKMTPREAYQSLIGTTIQFSDGDSAKIVNRLPNKDMYNELSKRYPSKFKNVENIKEVNGSINDNIEELLTNTTIKEANVPDFKDRHQKQGIKNFDTRTVKFYDGNNAYDIDFSIAVLEDGSKVAYAKKYIEGNQNLTQKIKTVEARSEKSSLDQQSLSKDSIAPSNNDVNTSTKYSIQESENNSGSFSLENKNSSWYDYLERTFPNKGTRTNLQDILVKKADNEGSYSTRNNKNNVANSLNTIYNNAKLGEVKQVPVETLLSIQNSTGGYRTQEQINNLKSDIRANGITTPIEIYKKSDGTFAIENGNHRLKIAQELGIKDVPVKLVKSWNDVGISKENVSGIDRNKVEDKYNDRVTRENSRFNDNSWNREGSMSNNNVQLENSGRTGRNAELYERTSNSNEFTSSNENKGNNRQQEVDDSTSFNMSNNAPSSDNNSFGTSTEENSWSRQQAEKKKQRKHYESIIKSNYTTDEAKAIAKELMGTDTYVPESNSRQLEVADERIASAGADSELNSLMSRATTGGNIKSDDIAVGERLIQYYSKTGDKFKLQEAIQATAMAGTTAGQTVQAMALLNHQTPEGQAIWLQRSVDKMNSDLRKTRGKNAEQFNLTAEMLEKVASSENVKALEENLNEVYKELGQQVTKTTAQKIDAWRYFSMLSSPKTHIRNITGNTAMAGVQGIKNKVAGTIEGVVGKFNSDMERTHTLKIASKEVKSFAKADIENVADRLGLNENKYNPKTRLENNMRTFKSDVMEKTVGKVFEINNNLLEAEDGWGLKAGYVKALSEYMTSNNLTPDTITDKQLSKARNYAVEQAKEATFHQDSKLASMINQFSNKNKFCKFILDSTLPFKKTPINVAKAGIEYSPVGLVKSAVYDTVKLRKGDITVNKYIDNISKGLTGTGIALVGYALADCGILKASGSDDEDRESFEEGRGSQNYSITIGDNTYSLDWLAPSGIPLFIGAECYELMQASSEKKTSSSDDDKIHNQIIESATNILDSFANAMNPMAEMSMLSGLTSALKSYEQGSSKIIAQFGINATKSYVNQFFPTGLGQIAKTIDGYERSTTSTKTSGLPKAIDSTKNQIMSKIPVLRELLPVKTDTWGAEMKQSDNVLVRALENSVLPWTRKELNSTDVDKEILSVYENTGENSVFPDSINKNITIDKQKYTMTSEEYAKYKQQYGQTSYNLLNSLIKSSGYKKLSDEQKQLAIEKIYSYSTEQIKVNYAKQNGLNYKQSTLSSVVNSIKRVDGNTSNYFEFLAKTQDLTKESEKVEILANSNYSNSTKTAIYENSLGKDDSSYKILKKSFTNDGLNITKYLKYVSQEFTSDKEDDGTVDGKTISGSKKDKVIDYINSISGTTYTQRILLYGLKYKPESISDRELIVNYIRDNWTGSERTEMFEQFTWITQYKNGKIGI